jgi:hypothetical protein
MRSEGRGPSRSCRSLSRPLLDGKRPHQMSRGATSLATTLVQGAVARTRAAQRPAPSLFHYPGLTAQPFWDPSRFKWSRALADCTPAILAEYDALISSRSPSDYDIADGEHTLHNGDWAWHSLVTKGVVQSRLATACPNTYEALLGTVGRDLLTGGVPFAYSFFSTLRAGASIAPHFGPSNTRLRVHLPLRVPSSDPLRCGIAVGGKVAAWVSASLKKEARHEVLLRGGARPSPCFSCASAARWQRGWSASLSSLTTASSTQRTTAQ